MENIKEVYDLELEKVVEKIKNKKANLILLQFPDGLKKYSLSIVDYLEKKTKAEFLIWFGECFGACDTPVGLEKIKPKIDLIIQFGHNEILPQY